MTWPASLRGGRRRSFSRFARRRGRRAAPDQEVATEDTEEQSVIWGSVAAADQDGCALKLICLLEAADSQADSAEKAVLSFLGSVTLSANFSTCHWLVHSCMMQTVAVRR